MLLYKCACPDLHSAAAVVRLLGTPFKEVIVFSGIVQIYDHSGGCSLCWW